MTHASHVTGLAQRTGRALVAAVAGIGLMMVGAPPAHAAAAVSISGVDGQAQASLDGPTTLQLSGSGFQSLQGGFGGIYVVFGTVKGSWRPSMGGVSGRDYLYVPDAQAKDNAGYERFVAFPGSSTGHTANGGVVDDNGNWSTTLVVPGPTFQAIDSTGQSVTVDCRNTQCGVITLGAHAVVNAANETFTPVSFGGAAAATPSEAPATASPEATGEVAPADVPEAAGEAIPEGPVTLTLGVDATTAVAGHALSFTARGFHPGEQVVVVLDDGVATVGPLTAGRYGELAGIMPLDADLRVGTHVLKLTGAASGASVSAELTVRRDPALVSAAELAASQDAAEDVTGLTPLETAIVVAAGLLVLLVVFLLVSGAARRGRARRARAQAMPVGPRVDQPATAKTKPVKPVKPVKDKAKSRKKQPVSMTSQAAPSEAWPEQLTEDLSGVGDDQPDWADQTRPRPSEPAEPPATFSDGAMGITEELTSGESTQADPDLTEEDGSSGSNGVLPAAEMMAQVKARVLGLRPAAEATPGEDPTSAEPQELKA